MGGSVTINTAHEDGKADYSAEVGALASAGGELLVVAGYVDQGGSGIIQRGAGFRRVRQLRLPRRHGVPGALTDNFGDPKSTVRSGQHPAPSDSDWRCRSTDHGRSGRR
jgi:branched-chain amino acid transport system substrate-binding protein